MRSARTADGPAGHAVPTRAAGATGMLLALMLAWSAAAQSAIEAGVTDEERLEALRRDIIAARDAASRCSRRAASRRALRRPAATPLARFRPTAWRSPRASQPGARR